MRAAKPFNPDYPYAVSEQGSHNIEVVKHTLTVFTELSDDASGGCVSLSRQSLSVFSGHLCQLLRDVE